MGSVTGIALAGDDAGGLARRTLPRMGSATRIALAERATCPPQAARRLAERQFWAIARRQLIACGFSSARIGRWLQAGRLDRCYPGVYAWGRAGLPEKGELAAGLLFAGTGSALGGLSMLWWCDLLPYRPKLIHVDAPGHASSRQDLKIRHPARIARRPHEGIPVAELPNALLAAAADLSHNALRNVLARADFEGLLHLPSLNAALRHGPKGSAALRRAMATHLPQLARCVNDFERDFVLLCEERGLPIPEPNVRKGRYVPDMTWESARLIVELDGKGAHTSPAQRAKDAIKQEWLEEIGYTVIRFGWGEVYFQRDAVAARVRSAHA